MTATVSDERAAGDDEGVGGVGPGGDDRGGWGTGGSGAGGSGGGDGGRPGRPDRPGRRSGRVAVVSAVAVGCVTALLIAVLATSKNPSSSENQAASPLQGKPAPEISGPGLGGVRASLSGYRGKWVLVNFLASWCVPCQQEQADLVRFQNAHAGTADAVIFGVRFDDPDTGPIEQLMNKSGGRWPVVDDPNAKIDYGVTGPPESFLIDPSGIVLVHIIGKINADALEQLLSQTKLVDSGPVQGGASSSGGPTPGPVGGAASTPVPARSTP